MIPSEVMEQYRRKETLIDKSIPIEQWTKLGMGIFSIEDKDFLITVDYKTNYFEMDLLKDKIAERVILKCKINSSWKF